MHNLVKSYLVHYAYVETLQAYEDEEMDWESSNTDKKVENEIDNKFEQEKTPKTQTIKIKPKPRHLKD